MWLEVPSFLSFSFFPWITDTWGSDNPRLPGSCSVDSDVHLMHIMCNGSHLNKVSLHTRLFFCGCERWGPICGFLVVKVTCGSPFPESVRGVLCRVPAQVYRHLAQCNLSMIYFVLKRLHNFLSTRLCMWAPGVGGYTLLHRGRPVATVIIGIVRHIEKNVIQRP